MSMVMRTGARSGAVRVGDSHDLIRVLGARVNNLKDVSVGIPKRRLTVFLLACRGRVRARWCSIRSLRSRSG